MSVEQVATAERELREATGRALPELCARIERGDTLGGESWHELLAIARKAIHQD